MLKLSMNLDVAMGGVGNLSPSYSLIVGRVKDHMLEILSLLCTYVYPYRRKAVLRVPDDVTGKRLCIVDKK